MPDENRRCLEMVADCVPNGVTTYALATLHGIKARTIEALVEQGLVMLRDGGSSPAGHPILRVHPARLL